MTERLTESSEIKNSRMMSHSRYATLLLPMKKSPPCTRTFVPSLALVAWAGALLLSSGCSDTIEVLAPKDGALGADGRPLSALGRPCIPKIELDPNFSGFRRKEVSIESRLGLFDAAGMPLLCLMNHFSGRTTCPFGQDRDGKPPAVIDPETQAPPGPCTTPSSQKKVNPTNGSRLGACIPAQCSDRPPEKSVYYSCRCANDKGRTDDGAKYCDCGAGLECAQLVTSVGPRFDDTSGAYCIKKGTQYDEKTACKTTLNPLDTTCN
jgi:hypothetical protein